MKHTATAIFAALLLAGCARVYVQPEIDLKSHEIVGIVTFSSNSKGDLAEYTTQKFIEAITDDQKEIQIVELGEKETVLKAVGAADLNPDSYRAIGEKYGVSTVIAGDLKISDIKPRISIGPGLAFASITAEVNALLSAKLVQTATGATIWSNSARSKRTVGGVSKFGDSFSFSAEDPDESYGALAHYLTREATRDFRQTWHYKCCGRK